MVVCALSPSAVSSFVTSVMLGMSLSCEVKKVRRLEGAVGIIARSIQESGGRGVVCSVGGSGSLLCGGVTDRCTC